MIEEHEACPECWELEKIISNNNGSKYCLVCKCTWPYKRLTSFSEALAINVLYIFVIVYLLAAAIAFSIGILAS